MICRKCGTGKKESIYCEKCGAEYKKEDININNNISPQTKQKINKNNLLTFIISILIISSLATGYYQIERNLTDKAEIERYCNYLTNGNYKKAYKMMSGIIGVGSEKKFIEYMERLNFKGKKLVSIEKIEMPDRLDYNGNIVNYAVVIGTDEMMFQIVKDQKKIFWLFDNWEVSSKGMIKEYTVSIPEGAELFVDNKKINTKSGQNVLLEAFPGTYELQAVLGSKEKKIDIDTADGDYISIDFDKVEQIKDGEVTTENENSITLEDPNNNPEIEKLVSEYKKKLVEAVNTQDFTIISPMLAYGSELYADNQDLISKGYKQKLIKCELIDYFFEDDKYYVFTEEEIEVKTLTDRTYKKQSSGWKYTLIKDFEDWQFSKVEKWEQN